LKLIAFFLWHQKLVTLAPSPGFVKFGVKTTHLIVPNHGFGDVNCLLSVLVIDFSANFKLFMMSKNIIISRRLEILAGRLNVDVPQVFFLTNHCGFQIGF
jgi:hypothetical protein